MNHRRRARIIGLSVLCMAAGSFVAKPDFAAPSTSGTSSAPVASCNGDKNVDIFNFNDFHGRINDLQKAVREITSKEWCLTCSPHHNHQDTAQYQVAGLLWFDLGQGPSAAQTPGWTTRRPPGLRSLRRT